MRERERQRESHRQRERESHRQRGGYCWGYVKDSRPGWREKKKKEEEESVGGFEAEADFHEGEMGAQEKGE